VRNAHDVATVRAAERALMDTLPPGTLMQRAAAGLAAVCAGLLSPVYGARVVVLAGSGDNGGDALYAGARLARRGAAVVAIAAGPRVHEAGVAALRAAGGRVTGADDPDLAAVIGAADLILDGLLGIGGKGGLREPYAGLAGLAEAARGRTVAVDLPSGIDADTGAVAGPAVRAEVTVTFGTWKPGLLIAPGAEHAGTLELIDIGLGPYLPGPAVAAPQAADVAALLPRPPADSDKYRRGVIGIVAGSDRFTGAAALAAGGAIRGGAGMVRLVSAPAAVAVVRQHWPEAVVTVIGQDAPEGEEPGAAGRVQAWVAGPGMGTDEVAKRRLAGVLATDLPVLVDADGLTILAAERGLLARSAPTVLTPHAGELGRLLGVDPAGVQAQRLAHASRAAAELGATVLLKGSTTVIATPDGAAAWQAPVLVNSTGTSWLATAGTGDVLSGLAGALLAQGLSASQAPAAAAFLHGLAARRAAAGRRAAGAAAPIGAGDVIRALPGAIRAVRGAG
jgi:hydroxyethylthiazole kinase-like uncharacterized protein yjeF